MLLFVLGALIAQSKLHALNNMKQQGNGCTLVLLSIVPSNCVHDFKSCKLFLRISDTVVCTCMQFDLKQCSCADVHSTSKIQHLLQLLV